MSLSVCSNSLTKRTTTRFIVVSLVDSSVLVSLLFLQNDEEEKTTLLSDLSNNSNSYELLHEGVTDLVVLSVIRIIFMALMVAFVNTRNHVENWKIKCFYWPSFFATVFIIAKAIVFDFGLDGSTTLEGVFVVFSAFAACIETYFVGSVFKENKLKELDDEEKKSKPGNEDEEVKELTLSELSKLLMPYFLPKGWMNKFLSLLTFVFLAASRVCRLISPLFIGSAIDELNSNDPDRASVFRDLAIFSGLTVISTCFSEMQRLAYLRVGQHAFVEIAEKTFRHLHSLSLDWHLKKKLGNVLRSLDRGVTSANTVVRQVFLNLLPTFVELAAVFVIFYKRFNLPFLSAMLFVGIVSYGSVTFQITTWRKKFRKKTNRHDNDYHDKATDSLINYETVKYFGNEDFETKRYIESIDQYQSNANKTIASLAFLNSFQQLIISASIMGALMIITTELFRDDSTVSVGDFVTAQLYMSNVFTPLSFLGFIYDSVIQAFVDIANLSQLLAKSPDIDDSPDAIEFKPNKKNGVAVEFENIFFSYPSNDAAGLHDVSFSVNPGDTLAIVGQTGAGKSTIGRLLFRFYDPAEGRVLISGRDIKDYTQKSLRDAIGVVPQDTVLFNDTLRHNLSYGKVDATLEEIEEACEAAQILDFIRALPDGFDTNVGERGLRLSGGEKQRVAVARCLLKNPPVVLLDEATSALDSRTERKVQEALNVLTQRRTTIIIAHRLSTIRHSDEIVVLDSGSVIERGQHDELVARNNGVYRGMWEAQQGENE